MRYFKLSKVVILFICLAMLSGCFSTKPSSQKGTKKLVESFYVGEAGIQYFIKPVDFFSKETNEKLLLDCTFRYNNALNERDTATLNFSILSEHRYKKLSLISLNSIQKNVDEIKLLYTDKRKQYISRFSTKLSVIELKKVFQSPNPIISLDIDQRTIDFHPISKSKRNIEKLNQNFFILID